MSTKEVNKYYLNLIEDQKIVLTKLKSRIFKVGTVRLLLVTLSIINTYIFWGNNSLVFAIIIASLMIFLILMNYHNKLFKEKKYRDRKVLNAQNELRGLDYDFSVFDGAPEKINSEHSFSLDLDLFGERSFFQSINRTVTSYGKDALADSLIHPLSDKKQIIYRQEAIQELQQNQKLLSHFRAIGQTSEIDKLNTKNFIKSFTLSTLLSGNKLWKILIYIIPILYILLAFLVYFNIVSSTLFLPLYLSTFFISSLSMKKVKSILQIFDSKTQVLDTYSNLFEIIESEKFDSELLVNIQKKLTDKNKASKAIYQLKSLYNKLLMSESYPILLLINPLLLWNIKYAIKVEDWTLKYEKEIAKWFIAISEFDALISWAIFKFNHPDYTYPIPMDNFIFEGKELGHPMLNRDVCVRNDIDISKTSFFLVVTGANMAGKSTYLRTIGINHTLACAGAPVCAESLKFYPGNLVTNLRTSDSLADNESYFFAELKRLKMIIDRLQSGEKLFIILDEILKGTNSIDKQKGSLALMKQLIFLNGNGIIATHDLVLGTLEKEYPNNVKNYRFEADITDDNLSFTYKIREGIAQNMNASFLMRKMGITGL